MATCFKQRRKCPSKDEKTAQDYQTTLREVRKRVEYLDGKTDKIFQDGMRKLRKQEQDELELKLLKRYEKNLENDITIMEKAFAEASAKDKEESNDIPQTKYELDKAHVQTAGTSQPTNIPVYPALDMKPSARRTPSVIPSRPPYQCQQFQQVQPQLGPEVLAERGFDDQQISTANLYKTTATPYLQVGDPERNVISDRRVRAGNLQTNDGLKMSSGVDKVSLIFFNEPEGKENEHRRRVMKAECGNIQNCKEIADTSIFTAGRRRMTFSAVAVCTAYGGKIFVYTWDGKLLELSKSVDGNWSWRKFKGTSLYGHGPEPPITFLDGKIYACGGGWEKATRTLPNGRKTGRFSSNCEVCNLASEEREAAPNMPQEIRKNSVIAANGCVFSVGGCKRSRPKRYSNGFELPDKGIATKDVTMYDPSTQKWRQMSSLREARVGPGLATSGQKIYALGGAQQNRYSYSDSIEIYDIPSNTCTIIAQRMQIGRMLSAQMVDRDEIIVFGGEKDRRGTIERISLNNTNDAPIGVLQIPGAERIMSMATVFFTE